MQIQTGKTRWLKPISGFITFIIFILLTSCHSFTVNPSGSFGFSLEEFNFSFQFPNDKTTIEYADNMLNGIYTVHAYLPAVNFKEGINWDIVTTESPSTFQLYLQSLNPVVFLTKAYALTGKTQYLTKAQEIFHSWLEYIDKDISEKNNMVWYDHGTALRAENIIYYALFLTKANLMTPNEYKTIRSILQEHATKLMSDSFYTQKHNHGIFQDKALIYTAYFLSTPEKETQLQKAKSRLSKQFNHAFNPEFVHVENSSRYHIRVLELFRTISDFLLVFNDTYGLKLTEGMDASFEFLAYLTKPNGAFPLTGDTFSNLQEGDNQQYLKSTEEYTNQHYVYARTGGQKGIKPAKNSAYYPVSGYYISHNSWDKNKYTESTWMMFKSGYSSGVHKHADDNSFILYSKGYDIFVDTGMYNYTYGNKYRDYFISSNAHNTLVVDHKTYSPTESNKHKVGIYGFTKTDSYESVSGYNDMYEGVSIDRQFINLGDGIMIRDNMASDSIHTYSQLFHCGQSMKLISQKENMLLFQIANSPYYVRVQDLTRKADIDVVHGDFADSQYGYISKQQNQINAIDTIVMEQTASNTEFLTLVTIEDEQGRITDLLNYNYNPDKKTFELTRKEGEQPSIIEFQNKERATLDNVQVQFNKNTLSITNNAQDESFRYAYYVMKESNRQAVYKSRYSSNNTFHLDLQKDAKLDQKENYLIRGYIRDNTGRRLFKNIDIMSFDKELQSWVSIKDHGSSINLIHEGHEYTKISERKYEFKVNIKYDLDYRIKWYIYKNSTYYDIKGTENNNTITYSFPEPGAYTLIYKIFSSDKDMLMYNFPQLEIQ